MGWTKAGRRFGALLVLLAGCNGGPGLDPPGDDSLAGHDPQGPSMGPGRGAAGTGGGTPAGASGTGGTGGGELGNPPANEGAAGNADMGSRDPDPNAFDGDGMDAGVGAADAGAEDATAGR